MGEQIDSNEMKTYYDGSMDGGKLMWTGREKEK
jgi:hypothetical protein